MRATIETPRFSKDHKCSRVFYILSPLDLNSIPDIEVSRPLLLRGWVGHGDEPALLWRGWVGPDL